MKRTLLILLVSFLFSCTKQELVVVDGNTPPQEIIVTQELKENYINRLFIALAGRKADNQEFDAALAALGDASKAERTQVIDNIFALPSYDHRLYQKARGDYIAGVDTANIARDFAVFTSLLATADANTKRFLEFELQRLQALLNIPAGLANDSLSIIDVHKRIVNNGYYDEINMGTENFVVASFNHFLYRYPTDVELAQASSMVDGFGGLLFFENGNSKTDFIEIFFSSDGYYEGLVLALFKENLFRDPTSSEMADLTLQFATDKDFQALQQHVLTSDEYFFN